MDSRSYYLDLVGIITICFDTELLQLFTNMGEIELQWLKPDGTYYITVNVDARVNLIGITKTIARRFKSYLLFTPP